MLNPTTAVPILRASHHFVAGVFFVAGHRESVLDRLVVATRHRKRLTSGKKLPAHIHRQAESNMLCTSFEMLLEVQRCDCSLQNNNSFDFAESATPWKPYQKVAY